MCDCGECVIVLWGEVKWVVEVGVFGCGGKALIVVICVYLIEAYTEWSIQITFYVLAIILYVISCGFGLRIVLYYIVRLVL